MKKQLSPNPFFKNLRVNTIGTDYYIGDLHGMFDLLLELLSAINFDFERDRLISTGDLVDRGMKSYECLNLLFEPWFHAVFANHEEMMMHAYNMNAPWHNWRMSESWIPNGGMWALEDVAAHLNDQIFTERQYQLKQIAQEKLPELPLILNVAQEDGRWIHVVHAEFPFNTDVNSATLQDEEALERIFNRGIDVMDGTNSMQWKRHRFGIFYKQAINAPFIEHVKKKASEFRNRVGSSENLVISGHTIVQQPVFIDNFLNIDTGAHQMKAPYGLTAYNSRTGWFVTAAHTPNGVEIKMDVQPFVLNTNSLEVV